MPEVFRQIFSRFRDLESTQHELTSEKLFHSIN